MLDTNSLIYVLIDASIEQELFENQLSNQLEFLTIIEQKHTGIGLF